MPIDEQVSQLDKVMEKIAQDDKQRRANQRIIPKTIDEAIENLLRARIVRSRFKALLLLAHPAAQDINRAVNNRITDLVHSQAASVESDLVNNAAQEKRAKAASGSAPAASATKKRRRGKRSK